MKDPVCGMEIGEKGDSIIHEGFKEVDEEGAKLEQRLKDIAKKYCKSTKS